MLVQDMLTGYVHEVPDQSYGGNLAGYGFPYGSPWRQSPQQYGHVVYDGFGNPLGLPILAALAPLAAKVLPAIATNVLPMVSSLLPGAAPPPAAMPAPVQAPAPPMIAPPPPAPITPLPPMA